MFTRRTEKRYIGPQGGRVIVVDGFQNKRRRRIPDPEPDPPRPSEEERYKLLAGDLLLTEEEVRYRRSLDR